MLRQQERRDNIGAVIRVSSGNFLEQYDFFVYGYYAVYIGKTFFPSDSDFASLMASLATFGAGFLMRPVGRWLFGRLADRKGRNMSMVTSVVMMCWGRPSHWPLSSLPPR